MGSALKYRMAVFEIYSESGTLQATGTQGIGFALASTGSVTLVDDGQTHPQPLVAASITVNATNPVLAFNAPVPTNVIYQSSSGSTHTFWLRARSSSPVGVQYWIFDTAQGSILDPTMSGIEFALWDGFGVKTFDAKTAMLRVVTTNETTMPQDGDVPYGNNPGGVGNSVSQVTVPAGRTYAVIQSTGAFINTQYDTGSYSNSEGRPSQNVIRPDDPGGTGPSSNWRYQNLESYHSSAVNNGSTITVGMTQFERFSDWYPRGSTPVFNVNGAARHTIIDVTGYTSAAPVNPGTITVGVNATSRTVTNGGAATISQSTTPSVTASASAGTAPYSYTWQRTSGSELVVANGSSTAATFSTSTSNQAQGTTRDAIWRCRVTDAAGRVGYSPEVTFTHIAQAYSFNVDPNPINPNALSGTTPNNSLALSTSFQITGITQPITLRVTGFNWSGNLSTARQVVYQRPIGTTTWNLVGQYSVVGYTSEGNFLDFTCANNTEVQVLVEGTTTSGIRSATWTYRIRNVTTSVNLADRNVSITVDNDNNYNVGPDLTPDAFTGYPSSHTINTNEHTAWSGYNQNVTGITAPITLRVERYSYSGNIDSILIHVYLDKRDGLGWQHQGSINPKLGGLQYLDVVVHPGWAIHTPIQATTNGGRQQATFQKVIWNLSTSPTYQVVTQNVSVTVDADNNYNLPIYTANPMSFSGVSTYDYPNSLGTGYFTNAATLTGPNRSITLRAGLAYTYAYVRAKQQWGDGQADNYQITSTSGSLYVYANNQYRGAITHPYLSGSGGDGATGWSYVDFTANPGDQISFYLDHPDPNRLGDGFGGTLSHVAGSILLDNVSAGQRLATFSHNNVGYGPDMPRGGGWDPGPGDPGGPIVITP